MKISCALPPVPSTPDHVVLAESLGYETAWIYDTPALQLDCWMTLALAAVRTERIRLGPGVMIPSLRHPMVSAAAIATLVGLVGPERVIVGAGTGFTGRRAMGQKPLSWNVFPSMVEQIKALLRGDDVEIDGKVTRMLHWPGQAIDRPIEVPWVMGVNGPRGIRAAADAGCGIFTSRPRPGEDFDGIDDVILLGFGTIMDEDESFDSERVLATAGPGVAVGYHAFLEQRDPRLDGLPNADRFVQLTQALPEETRHLEVHAGHLTELNAIDRDVVTADAMFITPLTCHAHELPGRLAKMADLGITEVAFQPMGDVERELRTFAAAAEIS